MASVSGGEKRRWEGVVGGGGCHLFLVSFVHCARLRNIQLYVASGQLTAVVLLPFRP